MRHGDAPLIDGERQLSENGKKEVRAMAKWLAGQSEPDIVLVSPILRAQQTAQQLEPFLTHHYRRADEELLKPEADAQIATAYFEALSANNLLLISHMPLVVNLLEAWLPGQGRYFPTATIAELEIKGSEAKLKQFISPDDLT